ncbi:hypothetical protein CYLTODRAFT_425424 [Cylindrobasidium torrendii FP15055 ss-10]|uniref:Carbohydrate kinase PfkB domain-containing protein n=1 Tax=Cylindrobasidium torrendii FP15055 ss-10 TaxID=1314674 RepID=A0A0D7B0T1_9AGAR|nr:hypothetical protein CYLTODRAFT_425424 [Cylindrobasidium torrendii FP15055 ss-10]
MRASRPLRFIQQASRKALQSPRYPIDLHPEVANALLSAQKRPVVALETTVITHGFPAPTNYDLGVALEDNVRSTGAIPATIGIIDGRVKIGLEKEELARLAERTYKPVKVSRRDIGPVIGGKLDGGTTCSATLMFAALAGIKIFATGGLGGVHRGGELSMDVSADLYELSRCPVGLVSSGCKSILDIGRTLEYLETLGVPVGTYGPTKDFPAFFTRRSGFQVPYNYETPQAVAEMLNAQRTLGMQNGALIGVPIPEEFEERGAQIQRAVEQAVAESEANGISKRGKEATPWLLQRVNELSGGISLESNIGLLKNNALVGGQIAVAMHNLPEFSENDVEQGREETQSARVDISYPVVRPPQSQRVLPPASLAVVGSAAVDIISKANTTASDSLAAHSTVPGAVELSFGGVGRNVAEAAHRVSADVSSTLLVSPVGQDSFGSLLRKETEHLGMRADGLIVSEMRTAVCNMLLSQEGDLITGVADMDITTKLDAVEAKAILDKHKPTLVAFDGNLSPGTIRGLLEHCNSKNISTFFEPTSLSKSTSILPALMASSKWDVRAPLTFSSPNVLELKHIYQNARDELMEHSAWWPALDSLCLGSQYRMDIERLARLPELAFLASDGIATMAVNLLPCIQHLVVKCGGNGVLVFMRPTNTSTWATTKTDTSGRRLVVSENGTVVVAHFPAHSIKADEIRNVTGAGDSFVGVLLGYLQLPETTSTYEGLEKAVREAQKAAVMTLQSERAVAEEISTLEKV